MKNQGLFPYFYYFKRNLHYCFDPIIQKAPTTINSDLDRIAQTLEVHKTDYTLVTEIQTENASLRKTLLKRTTEVEALRSELDSLKKSHSLEIEALKRTHDTKVEELRKTFDEKLKQLSEELNAKLEQERAEFCAQRDAWNEERASLLVQQASEMAQMMKSKEVETPEDDSDFKTEVMRQISEMQNQAREQVAQLQSRIEELMTMRPSPKPNRSSASGRNKASSTASPLIQTNTPKPPAPKWPVPLTPTPSAVKNNAFLRPINKNTPAYQNIGPSIACTPIGQKRPFTMTSTNENTPQGCAKPSLVGSAALPTNHQPPSPSRKLPPKVAAVPPVLVVAEEPHPLLGEKSPETSISKVGTKGSPATTSCVELPHSRWTKASDVIQCQQIQQQQQCQQPSYFQLPCSVRPEMSFMQPGAGEWFDCYQDDQSQSMDNCSSSYMPPPSPPPPSPPPFLPTPPPPPQQRRRHLFTVQSGSE